MPTTDEDLPHTSWREIADQLRTEHLLRVERRRGARYLKSYKRYLFVTGTLMAASSLIFVVLGAEDAMKPHEDRIARILGCACIFSMFLLGGMFAAYIGRARKP